MLEAINKIKRKGIEADEFFKGKSFDVWGEEGSIYILTLHKQSIQIDFNPEDWEEFCKEMKEYQKKEEK